MKFKILQINIEVDISKICENFQEPLNFDKNSKYYYRLIPL